MNIYYKHRIAAALARARHIRIDDGSKLVLMSDCHRGCGDNADDFADNARVYFHALSRYFDQGYTYIELGDGDELWENKHMAWIDETHGHVFWLLSKFHAEKRLHMLYGNHDMVKRRAKWRRKNLATRFDEAARRNVALFGGMDVPEALVLDHAESGKTLALLHGHQADFFNDQLWQLAKQLVRHLWRPLEMSGVKDPSGTAQKRHRLEAVEKRLMAYAAASRELLIAGHTHRPVFPLPGSAEPPYFNDGCCVHPRCITAMEITGGGVALVKWAVEARGDGSLFIGRTVLEGPVAIGEY